MRLTLRTLLAYLDGILEPKDAEDLGKKIEESEYASGLVHRVRDVMRRLRLGAPSVSESGPGLDPNTVAEYLDNTLAPDRVTDFEKVCLDSDTHLAEVAASHQILTLVLGEPAEIDEATRQRVYEVKDVHGGAKPPPTPTAHSAETAATAAAAPSLSLDLEGGDADGRKPRPRPTVPEYLREPRRRRRWLTAAAAAAALCVLVLILGLFGEFEPGSWFGDVLVSCGLVSPKEVASNAGKPDDKEKMAGKEGGAAEKGKTPADEHATEVGKEPAVKPGVEPQGKSPAAKPAEKPTTTGAAGAGAGNGAKSPATSRTVQKPDNVAAAEPKKTSPIDGTKPPVKPHNEAAAPTPKPEHDAGKEAAPLPPNVEPEPLGRLLSSEQVLLSDNPPNGWTRVAANQMLIPQQVLALPTYRPKIGLTSGVTVEMLGGTRLELLGSSAKDLSGVRVLFGRVVLMPIGKGDTRLRVEFGDHHGTITFVDAESIAALEVHHLHAPGTNPESESARVTADLFVSGGAISWEETVDGKAGKPQRLAPSQRMAFDGQVTGTPVAAKELPRWIAADAAIKGSLSPKEQLDRRASPVIAQSLPTDQPARLELLVLATSRPQWEVKWLSLRCLTYVGQFHDMLVALNDATQKAHWPDYIEAIRLAVDRDAETAAAVRVALEKQYPQRAAELYRMFWRYTDKQLASGDDGKGGEDAKLVRALDDDLLAVRVLSYANLKEITGQGAIYRPEDAAARRQRTISSWHRRLDAKEIRLTKAEPRGRPAPHEKVSTPAPDRGE
ncbi:MAG: hypothetical protein WCB27_08590 [Thermoguttaceae bacterium]